jgi:tape measure domain-containing protein
MNEVNLPIRLHDIVSDPLKKIGGTSKTVFTGVDKDIAGTQKYLDELGKPVRFTVDTSAINRAHGEVEGLGQKMRELSELKLVGGMAAGELVAHGVERAVEFAKEQVRDVLEGGMEEGKVKMQMQVLAGEKDGTELFEDIHHYIPKSLFGPELNHEAVVLMGMGETVKNILPDLKEFGDISMGDAQKMQSLALALGEAKNEGHLSGREMMILRTTGFNPLVETARVTGVSVESLMDKMSDGKFTVDMFRKAMEYATSEGGRFYHMQQRMMETPFGKKMQMATNVEQAKAQLGVALLPAEARVMDAFMPLINNLPAALDRMQPAMERTITGFADMVKWTSNNTETIGKWLGVMKVGVEAWAAWKLGTTAMTAANWLWTTSMGAVTAESAATSTALAEENALLGTQIEEVNALTFSWANMAEAKAAAAAAGGAFNLPINMSGVAAGASSGAMAAGAGAGAALGQAVIPVAIMYMAGEVLGQLLPKGANGETFDLMTAISYGKMEQYLLSVWSKPDAVGSKLGHALGKAGMADHEKEEEAAKASKAAASAAASEASDAIIGGGKKVVNISFKNFVENLYNNPSSTGEAVTMNVQHLKVMLDELLAGVPS